MKNLSRFFRGSQKRGKEVIPDALETLQTTVDIIPETLETTPGMIETASKTRESVKKVKGAVFRVTGIPLAVEKGDLEAIITSEFLVERVTVITDRTRICSSCNDRKTKTAFIQFTPHSPGVLDKIPNGGTYEVEIKNPPCDISIDKDFYGLTQVYPTKGKIKADIVAVSGLNGHAYGSWRGRGNHQRMWLCDFLSEDFPSCRTTIYGYNSRLEGLGTHTILDYAKIFLEELAKARQSHEEKCRPIVFIGHSFGGIIIAQSLVRAKETGDMPLFQSTRATIFFGTPHRGLVVDDMLAMIGENSPRAALVNSIQTQAELLENELQRFIDYSVGFKIVNFIETQPTKKLKKGTDGQWSRSGDYFMAVERKSSVLQLPNKIEQTLPIEGDHSTMVKFQSKGTPAYTSIVRHINSFIPEAVHAESAVEWIENHLKETSNKMDKPFDGLRGAPQHAKKIDEVLSEAASHGQRDIVQLMLDKGAALTFKDRNGNTALHRAVQRRRTDVVLLLLGNGADIMARGFGEATPLIMAAANGYMELVLLLWKRGTDVTATDSNGHTVLHAAAQNGRTDLVQLLLDGGVEIKTIAGDDTPLILASEGGYIEVVEVLLDKGSNIMERGRRGFTALHTAAQNGHTDVVKLLLKRGADSGARTNKNSTPLSLATTDGHKDVVQLLLNEGVD